MCLAMMFDSEGDKEILAAQAAISKKLDDWVPKILAAQEPNGYLQTYYTLSGRRPWTNKGDHEGYTAGYFIESALAHCTMTGKRDDPMYLAARRLADCWCERIGPARKSWYDGHEELEQALVRLGKFVDAEEGPGKGRKYIDLARFLLDCRAQRRGSTTRATCRSRGSTRPWVTPCGRPISTRAWPAWRWRPATSICKAPCSRSGKTSSTSVTT